MVTSAQLSGAAFLAVGGLVLILGFMPAKKGKKPASARARAARLAFVAVLLLAGIVTLFPAPAEQAFLTQVRIWLELPARQVVQRFGTASPELMNHATTPLTALLCALLAFVLGGARRKGAKA